jgi:hypothetical protein
MGRTGGLSIFTKGVRRAAEEVDAQRRARHGTIGCLHTGAYLHGIEFKLLG